MKNFFTLLIVIILVKLTYGQNISWTRYYGGSWNDYSYSIQQTTDGGYIVAGGSYSTDGDVHGSHGPSDAWILKLNEYGDTLWTKCYGGSKSDRAYSIQQTTDGGYVVANRSYSDDGDVHGHHGDQYSSDYWILKLNEYGDTIWSKCFGGSDFEIPYSIQQTSDGGYIVAGESASIDGDLIGNHGGYDYWILKLNEFGDILWSKCYGGSSDDNASSIIQTTDGGYAVAGFSKSNDGDVNGYHGDGVHSDFWVLKLDENGDIIWSKCYGGFYKEDAYAIQQTTDGGYVIAGISESNTGDVHGNHGGGDAWIIKLNEYGDTIWTKCLGGSGIERAYSIQQTTDGGYIIGGITTSNDGDVHGFNGTADVWIIKINELGDTLWTRCFGEFYSDYARHIQQTSDGGYIITGYSNIGIDDYYLILKLDNVAGVSAQYLPDIIQVFPNPTMGLINIKTEKDIKIEFFNILGETILVSDKKSLDISNRPSGLYFIKVICGDETLTKIIFKE